MKCTPMRRGDRRAVFRLVKQDLLPLKQTFFPEADVRREEIEKRLAKGTTLVLRDKESARIAGFCHFYIKGKDLWIDMLAVDRRFRRKGGGTLLMRQAERCARRRGCLYASLYVDELNWIGQRFYRKQGYRPLQYHNLLHVYLYRKRLDSRSSGRDASDHFQ